MTRSTKKRAAEVDVPEQSADGSTSAELSAKQARRKALKEVKLSQQLERQEVKAAKQGKKLMGEGVKHAKHDRKADIKAEKKNAKAAKRTEKKHDKATKKAEKKHDKAVKKGEFGRITPSRAKKAVAVAKVVGPAMAPFALKAASSAREGYEQLRARRLGVSADDLGRFSGKGAALHARIAGDAEALRDLHARSADRDDEEGLAIEQFAGRAQARLVELTSAVRAAERMPAGRRRAAHRAVTDELGRIEDDLLHRFGV